jgi:hypothetical protein
MACSDWDCQCNQESSKKRCLVPYNEHSGAVSQSRAKQLSSDSLDEVESQIIVAIAITYILASRPSSHGKAFQTKV